MQRWLARLGLLSHLRHSKEENAVIGHFARLKALHVLEVHLGRSIICKERFL